MRFLSAIDLKLFLPAVFLTILGTVVLASVAPQTFPEQFIHISVAFLVFLFFARLNVRFLSQTAWWLYFFSLGALILTLLAGAVTRGTVRWLTLGPLTLQPSEFVKPLLLIFAASLVGQEKLNRRFLIALVTIVPALVLILIQPALGSTLVVAAGFLGVIFISGVPLRAMFGGAIAILVASPIIWRFLAGYQKNRLLSFLNPTTDPLGSGYNAIQAMIAVGSGGLLGRGLGQGTQSQLAFLPERQNDFIFAALSEELGLLGAILVIIAFAFLFFRLIEILRRAPDTFSAALLGGIFLTLFSQTAINIAMNLGLAPITGIQLPFVSSGGSSLVAMAATLGIASSLSQRLKDREHLSILA